MGDNNRRTSIYDLTGLRVHPDGLRVHQTQENLRLGKQQRYYNTQDFRGWIANGAGGSVMTPKYRKCSQTSSPDAENLESLVEAACVSGESSRETVSSTKGKRKDMSNTRRALKRKKFVQDDSYIFRMPKMSSGTPRLPSQDLLKNIHCFAANYYDQNGLLINASKRYRKLRKLNGVSSEPALTGVQINEDKEIDNAEQIAVEGSSVQQQRKVNRDMYRVLDGSVLVAIGVFTEEIVKKLLQGREKMTHQQFEEDLSFDDEASKRSDFDDLDDDRPCNEWGLQQQPY